MDAEREKEARLSEADLTAGPRTHAGANRRAHARLPAENLTGLGAKLGNGAHVRLIDLSRSGAQFECERRFLPNAAVSLRLITADTTFVVTGRVVRSRIVRLDRGGLGYAVAVSLSELLQNLLEEPADASSAPEASVRPDTPEVAADVSAEEAAAFEARVETAPTAVTVATVVEHSSDELRDLFNGNNW